jgi:phosphopantothenoylcysteine synthetase/decarboxylase
MYVYCLCYYYYLCMTHVDAEDEWADWKQLGDSILHIDLRDWADLLVIAPLSAHTLAKLANGLCDDTLSCVVRAWDFGHHATRAGKPMVLAPAMNTAMWEHPLTEKQLDTFADFWNPKYDTGVYVVAPQVKQLACGEVGDGALAPVENVISQVKYALERHAPQQRVIEYNAFGTQKDI